MSEHLLELKQSRPGADRVHRERVPEPVRGAGERAGALAKPRGDEVDTAGRQRLVVIGKEEGALRAERRPVTEPVAPHLAPRPGAEAQAPRLVALAGVDIEVAGSDREVRHLDRGELGSTQPHVE